MSEPLCGVCKKPESEHFNLNHEFSADGRLIQKLSASEMVAKPATSDSSSKGAPVAQGRSGMMLRGDPVLRMALIRKGVISPQDLANVEDELRASGIIYGTDSPSTGGNGGDSEDGPGGPA